MNKWYKLIAAILVLSGLAYAQIDTTIYAIQYERDTLNNSLWLDSLVTVTGIVTVPYGVTGSGNFFIEMKQGGPWSGIMVYTSQGPVSWIEVGDSITITGTVSEWYGNTELYVSDTTLIIFHGVTEPPAPETLTCGYLDTTGTAVPLDPDSAEAYEGVLVTLQGVFVTDTAPGTAGFEVSDGTGYAIVYNNYSYTPKLGDVLNVTGVVHTHYGYYKVRPRGDEDYEILTPGISIAYSTSRENLVVKFKTAMDASAEDPTKYVIEDTLGNTIAVLSAVLDSVDSTVAYLTTDTMTDGMPYKIYTIGLYDAAGYELSDTFNFYGGFTPLATIQSEVVDTISSYPSTFYGKVVTVTGVITGEKDVWAYPFFFIQQGESPWSAIQIWDPEGVAATTTRGDSVIIVGTVTEYNGFTEIGNLLYYEVVGPGIMPEPLDLTIDNLVSSAGLTAESYEAMLVRVSNAIVSDPGTGGDWEVYQIIGSDTFYLSIEGDNAIGYTYRPADSGIVVTVTGILRAPGALYPRDDADIVESGVDEGFASGNELLKVSTPVNTNLTVEFTLPTARMTEVALYNVAGQRVKRVFNTVAKAGTTKLNVDVSNLPQGVYFLNLKAGDINVVRRVTIVK